MTKALIAFAVLAGLSLMGFLAFAVFGDTDGRFGPYAIAYSGGALVVLIHTVGGWFAYRFFKSSAARADAETRAAETAEQESD